MFLGRLLERFAERREDAGPRGGRRQTKHQGRVDTEVAEVGGGNLFGGRPSPSLTDEKNRWYSAGAEGGWGSENRTAVRAKHVALQLKLGAVERSSEKSR